MTYPGIESKRPTCRRRGISGVVALVLCISGLSSFAAQPQQGQSAVTRLSGSVVDHNSAPIASAWVGLVATSAVATFKYEHPKFELAVRTNGTGKFELIVPRELGPVKVVARAPNLAPARSAEIALTADERVVPTLGLKAGMRLSGRVVDEKRAAVMGAAIAAASSPYEDTTPPEAKQTQAVSVSAGAFTLRGLEPSSYDIRAQHPKYAPRTVHSYEVEALPSKRLLEIELFAPTFVSGRVLDRANRPIPKATVVANPQSDAKVQATADAQGRFRLGPFARAANVAIVASAQGFSPARSDGVLAPVSDVLLLLDRVAFLRGRVVDADSGKPVSRFEIIFHHRQTESRSVEEPGGSTFQSSEGRFEFPNVRSGVWTITARAPGYQPLEVPGVVVTANAAEELVLSMRKGRSIRGRVFDQATRLPIAAARVRLDDTVVISRAIVEPPKPEVLTDPKGMFVLDGLPGAPATLAIGAQGYASQRRTVSADRESFVEIGLATGASISGRVVAADGVTPVKAMLMIWDLSTATGGGTSTDADGYFTRSNLHAGRYRLSAETERGKSNERDVAVADNQQVTGVMLTLQAGVEVRGKVSGLLPGERGGVSMEARIDGGGTFTSTRTNEQDAYVLYGIPPAQIEVIARTSLGRQIAKRIEVSKSGDVTVDFEFPSGARVSGRVTRAGKPVSWAEVLAAPLEGQQLQVEAHSAQSGEYVLEGLAPGGYTIKVVGGARAASIQVSGDAVLNFELPALSIAGQVFDASDGTPLSGADVNLRWFPVTSGRAALGMRTNHAGQFSGAGLDAGSYELTVYKPDYDLFVQTVAVSASTAGLSIQLQPARGIQMRVRDAVTSQPLRIVHMSVSTASGATYPLDIPLDGTGLGYIPASLAGRDLSISWFGYQPTAVKAWNGSPLDVLLAGEKQH